MKIKTSLHKRCNYCKIHKRNKCIFIYCKVYKKHKQKQK